MYAYDTVTEAIEGLRKRGYTEDFNLEENCLVCNAQRFTANDFEILEVYRFEGDSDPADEAVVYGIGSKNGIKGILVNAYGYQSERLGDEIAKKLSVHTN